MSLPLPVYANYADAELKLTPNSYPDSVFRGTDEEEDCRYADAVFYFANNNTRGVHATYSAPDNSNNKVLRTIYRKRFTLPQRRGGRVVHTDQVCAVL